MTETSGQRLVFTKAGPGITCHWHDPDGDGECGAPAVQVAVFLDDDGPVHECTFCARHQDIAGQLRRQYQSRHN